MAPLSPTELLRRGAARSGIQGGSRQRVMSPFEQTQNLAPPVTRPSVNQPGSHAQQYEDEDDLDDVEDDDDENTGETEEFEEAPTDGVEVIDIEDSEAEGAIEEGVCSLHSPNHCTRQKQLRYLSLSQHATHLLHAPGFTIAKQTWNSGSTLSTMASSAECSYCTADVG